MTLWSHLGGSSQVSITSEVALRGFSDNLFRRFPLSLFDRFLRTVVYFLITRLGWVLSRRVVVVGTGVQYPSCRRTPLEVLIARTGTVHVPLVGAGPGAGVVAGHGLRLLGVVGGVHGAVVGEVSRI